MTLVILLAMADAFGLVGLILAPPLSAVCQILWKLLFSNRLAPSASAQISDLKERQTRLGTAIKKMEGKPPPLVISSMQRLAELLEKAEPILLTTQTADTSNPFHQPQSLTNDNGAPTSMNRE
jgi:hypothetical protein